MKRNALALRASLFCLALLAAWLLDTAYSTRIREIFAGVDFYDSLPSVGRRILSWLLVAVPLIWLPLSIDRPSVLVHWVLEVLVVIPTGVLGARSPLTDSALASMLTAYVGAMLMLSAASRLRLVDWRVRPLSHRAFVVLVVLEGSAAVLVLLRTFGSDIQLVSFADVYVQRARWMDLSAGTFAAYAQSWLGTVIAPLVIAVSLHQRRWILLCLGCMIQIFVFSIAAQRGVLLSPLIALGWWALASGKRLPFGAKLIALAAVAASIPLILDLSGSISGVAVAELTLNRPFLNNGYLPPLYFDFFSSHPHVLFSDVKGVSAFVHAVYPESYKEALAWNYFGYASDPNANFVADGFAQLGYTGVLIETLLVAGALAAFDAVVVGRRLPFRLVVLSLAVMLLVFVNGQMPTILLGGGFVLYLLHLAWIPESVTVERSKLRAAVYSNALN